MSTVVCEELVTTLTQKHRQLIAMNIAGIKVNILASSPSITAITIEVFKDAELLFSKSLTFEKIKEMGETTYNNWHGFVPFIQEGGLYLTPGDYEIKMSATGYTYSYTNFIGWCKDYVCTIGNTYGAPITHYTMNPYSYRLIEFQPREI